MVFDKKFLSRLTGFIEMRSIFQFIEFYNLPPITSVIQVGASVGQEVDLFLDDGVSSAVLIEPIPHVFQLLLERCKFQENFLPLNCLVGSEGDRTQTLYVASNFGQSSRIFEPTRHTQVYPGIVF